MTPYEQYLNMLRDERRQFEKMLTIIGQNTTKPNDKVLGELSLT